MPEIPPAICVEPPLSPSDTTTILGPCGTLVPYDPINGKNDPEKWGVPGGYSADGSIQYVAYGNGKSCGKMDKCPGYINTVSGECRMPCQIGKKEIYDNNPATCYYLTWSPNLEWQTTTPAKADRIPGVLTRNNKGWWLMYARMCAPDDRVTVGRVHYSMKIIIFIF